MSDEIITPKQLADELFLDPKTVRNAMRRLTSKDAQPGSGGRWNIKVGSEFDIALRAHLVRTNGNKNVVIAELAVPVESTD